jgi:ankyrin repeat protein
MSKEAEIERAARRGKLNDLEKALQSININAEGIKELNIALTTALENGHPRAAEKILTFMKTHELKVDGHEALYLAVKEGHKDIAKKMVALGANCTQIPEEQFRVKGSVYKNDSPLILALKKGYKDLIAEMVNKSELGETELDKALTVAINYSQEVEMIEMFIDKGAKFTLKDLHRLVDNLKFHSLADQYSLTKSMLKVINYADIEQLDDTSRGNNTVLVSAVSFGHKKLVSALLARGVDVNIQTRFGWNALMEAAYSDKLEMLDILLKVPDIKLDLQNSDGKTALYIALSYNGITQRNSLKIAEKLVDAGADCTSSLNIALKQGYHKLAFKMVEKIKAKDPTQNIYELIPADIAPEAIRGLIKHAAKHYRADLLVELVTAGNAPNKVEEALKDHSVIKGIITCLKKDPAQPLTSQLNVLEKLQEVNNDRSFLPRTLIATDLERALQSTSTKFLQQPTIKAALKKCGITDLKELFKPEQPESLQNSLMIIQNPASTIPAETRLGLVQALSNLAPKDASIAISVLSSVKDEISKQIEAQNLEKKEFTARLVKGAEPAKKQDTPSGNAKQATELVQKQESSTVSEQAVKPQAVVVEKSQNDILQALLIASQASIQKDTALSQKLKTSKDLMHVISKLSETERQGLIQLLQETPLPAKHSGGKQIAPAIQNIIDQLGISSPMRTPSQPNNGSHSRS